MSKDGNIKFKLDFESKPEKPLDIIAFVFDKNGNLINSEPIKTRRIST